MAEPTPAERRALFADTFSGTTDLDQRRRFQQELTEAKSRSDARDRAEFERVQIERPEVGRLMVAREREERLGRESYLKQNLAERKFEDSLTRFDRTQNLREKLFDLQSATRELDDEKKALDIFRATKAKEQTLQFEKAEMELRESFGTGSQEYRNQLTKLMTRLPYLDKEYRNAALQELGYQDPEAAFQQATQMIEGRPGSRATVKFPGGTVSVVEPKPPREEEEDLDLAISKAFADRSAAKKALKANPDEGMERLTEIENQIKQLEQRRAGPRPQTTAPTTPATRPPLTDIYK